MIGVEMSEESEQVEQKGMINKLIVKTENEEYEYEDIKTQYVYDEKKKTTHVRYFPFKNIATVTKTVKDDGTLTTEITKKGMTLDDILKYFPPDPQHAKNNKYDLQFVIRSIIYEAFKKEGTKIETGNVRNFWYTHLKYVVTRILGKQGDIEVSLDAAWKSMINSGLVTYEGMNVIGGKETSRLSIVKDSPFNNLIVAIEKADYFDYMKWIPQLFNCTLITAGGQPSRAVARAFIKQLKDLEADLNKEFYMCVASDMDPAGYYIEDAFRKQFEAAILYYGGSGKVKIKRLFVRKDQVSEELLESEAVPCGDKAKTERAKKNENTKWKSFCDQTEGGIYIPVPIGWDGPTEMIDGEPKVRALLEMNAFSKKIIESAIVKELLQIIEETNDESKIMIPEIMRVFGTLRGEISDDVYNEWHRRLIRPLIDSFLADTNRWEYDISDRYDNEHDEAAEEKDKNLKPRCHIYDVIEETERYETAYEIDAEEFVAKKEIEAKDKEARDRVPDLYDHTEFLAWQINELKRELEETNVKILVECVDVFDKIRELENGRDAEIETLKNSREDEIEYWESERANDEAILEILSRYEKDEDGIENRLKYRNDALKKFREDHTAIFNPVEMSLKNDVDDKLSCLTNGVYFHDLERADRFQPYISDLLTDPNLLLNKEISCFDHPVPAFVEENLLKKASAKSDENVENVRNAFPASFLEEMKRYITSLAVHVNFELKGETPSEDLTAEVTEAMESTENEIEKWEDNYE